MRISDWSSDVCSSDLVIGQCQHGDDIVGVHPGALAFARPEGKKILENALMRDDAADNRYQHEHGVERNDPARHGSGHVLQFVRQTLKKIDGASFPDLSQPLNRCLMLTA